MTGLETILAQHDYALGLKRGSICLCGHIPTIDPSTLQAQQDYHRAHVADQIRGWLLSDEAIEQAASEHQWPGGYFCTCGHELNSPIGFSRHLARAALTAALDTTGDT